MLKIILIALPVIIAVFAVVAAMQPSAYRVTRSLAIAAPPAAVFPHMNDLKKWEAWNPWGKADPNIKLTYGGPASGVGANYSWTGNNEAFCLFMSMDKMIGGKFEKALVDLKTIAASPMKK